MPSPRLGASAGGVRQDAFVDFVVRDVGGCNVLLSLLVECSAYPWMKRLRNWAWRSGAMWRVILFHFRVHTRNVYDNIKLPDMGVTTYDDTRDAAPDRTL